MFAEILTQLKDEQSLNANESEKAIGMLLDGAATNEDIASFLKILHQRGETEEEVLGAAMGLRSKMKPFDGAENAIDCCGTGGDNHGTYNISTAVAFVLAGAGIKIAKHGNRAVSSKSGSSDLLNILGVKIDADSSTMRKAYDKANICFLMAPLYHPAMKHVAAIRANLGHRSIFNLLGPLANPARVRKQLVGVFTQNWLAPYTRILQKLGSTDVLAVHGADGLDEITTTDNTHAVELHGRDFLEFSITPEHYGFPRTSLAHLKGGDAHANAAKLTALLDNEAGAYRDIVLLNSAAAAKVAGKVKTIAEGVDIAKQSLESGKAKSALQTLIEITNG